MLPLLIAAAAVGLGLYAISRPSSPNGPTYRVAPGGVGRIYGTPDVPIASAFWVSPDIEIGCRKSAPGKGTGWIAEGARFLPAGDITVKQPRATLAEALATEQSAWPYVEFLYRQTPEELTRDLGVVLEEGVTKAALVTALLMAASLMPWILAEEQSHCDEDTFGRAGTPAYNWGQDVLARVQAYEFARL